MVAIPTKLKKYIRTIDYPSVKSNHMKQLFAFLFLFNWAFAQIPNPHKVAYNWKTDTTRHTPDFNELTIVAAKDELRTLDFPLFISKTDSLYNYYEFEPAIVLSFGNEHRAYPLSVLTLYELSNDTIGGKNVMVTFCPMCNAAMVYNRQLKTKTDEQLLTFGISGLLLHNDMVMYDRETESWWMQIAGEGIAGKYSSAGLRMLPAMLISVKDFFDRFPDGKILSPEALNTYLATHKHRPFYHLEHGSKLSHKYYLPEKTGQRLPPLEHVLDVHLLDYDRIYPYSTIAKLQVINTTAGQTDVVIFYHSETVSVLDRDNLSKSRHTGSATAFNRQLNGKVYTFRKSGDCFTDDQTNSRWDITGYCREGALAGQQLEMLPHSNHFAFAYLAFYPDVEIYKP